MSVSVIANSPLGVFTPGDQENDRETSVQRKIPALRKLRLNIMHLALAVCLGGCVSPYQQELLNGSGTVHFPGGEMTIRSDPAGGRGLKTGAPWNLFCTVVTQRRDTVKSVALRKIFLIDNGRRKLLAENFIISVEAAGFDGDWGQKVTSPLLQHSMIANGTLRLGLAIEVSYSNESSRRCWHELLMTYSLERGWLWFNPLLDIT